MSKLSTIIVTTRSCFIQNIFIGKKLQRFVKLKLLFQFHQRYNPNLIDDDDQEMESLLKKRHARARKISEIVLQNQEMFRPGSPGSVVSEESRVTMTRATKHVSCKYQGWDSPSSAIVISLFTKIVHWNCVSQILTVFSLNLVCKEELNLSLEVSEF